MPERRAHIAVVIPSLTRAGAERVAETLAREFVRTSRVTVVTMEPRIGARDLKNLKVLPWADMVPSACGHVHLPSRGAGVSRLVLLVVRFAILARRMRFDAVYSFLTWTNILVALAKLCRGRYLHIASEHAMAESLQTQGDRIAWLARTLPFVYRLPNWLVVVSNAARKSLLAAGAMPRPDRAVTIPNPVDSAHIRSLAQSPPESPVPDGKAHLVACVGRLHEQKDHITLLRAMAHLPPCYALIIVGDGPLRRRLHRTVAELDLADRVMFTGVVSNPYPFMQKASVVVLSSREEGFGLVAAEAAVLNVPFIGSDVGGLGEVCRLLGHRTFPAGDPEALATEILASTSSTNAKPAAGNLVDQLFDPGEIAAQYLRLSVPGLPRKASPSADAASRRGAE